MTENPKRFSSAFTSIILRIPWLWLLIAFAGSAFFGYYLSKVQYEFSLEAMFKSDSPYRKKMDYFTDLFGHDDNVLILAHGSDDLFSPEGYKRISEITDKLEALPYFEHVITLTSAETITGTPDGFATGPLLKIDDPKTTDWEKEKKKLLEDPLVNGALLGDKGWATALSMEIKNKFNNNDGREQIIADVEKILVPYHDGPGVWHITGLPHLRNAFVKYMKKDQATFLPLVSLIINILAFWLFRSLKANGFSLFIIALSTLWTMGALALGGGTINIITAVMPSLIMTLGMAYVTHYLSRYIEETSNGLEKREAIFHTTSHMMLPIFLTSFTTSIGFISLMVMKVDLVRQFGLYSAIGLMFAFWLSITVLPALALYFKPFHQARSLFSADGLWGRYLAWNDRFVKNHPWPVIVVSLMLVLLSVYFVTQVRVESKLMEESNPNSPEYAAHEFAEKHLVGIVPLEILITADSRDAFKEPENLAALEKLQDYLRQQEGVDYTFSFVDVLKKMNQAMNENDPASYKLPQTRQAVAQYLLLYDGDQLDRLVTGAFDHARIALRCQDIGSKNFVAMEKRFNEFAEKTLPKGLKADVTGSSIMIGKLMDRLIVDMVKSLFMAAMIITVLMAVLFRSVRLGLLAMIPNFIPILMTMGMLGALGITLRTSIVVVFSISLGIAVDDTIHFISRCRNEYKKTGNYDTTLTRTFLGTGRPIVFTSVLLFLGFSTLALSSFIPTRNFGLLSAVTMVSALLGDLFLLPALLWVFKPKLN